MKKRVLKISAFCLAMVLIVGVCWFANGLVGNPVSKMLARHTAQKHLEATYPNSDYKIESVSYDFKTGGYYARIVSEGSIDENFSLSMSMLGKLTNDNYSSLVEGRGNVASRLSADYREMIDSVLNSYAFPYSVYMGYGRLRFDYEAGEKPIEGAIKQTELVNNKFYNVGELGAKNGEFVLYIDSDVVTNEKAAEILLKTKELMDQAGLSFYSIHLVLRYPPRDEASSNDRPEGRIDLREFLYTDIYEEGLIERISKCAEDTQNYYNEQDKIK